MKLPLYVRTVSKGKVWLDDPEKSDAICLPDIAYSLANTCRFVGQLKTFYSVAEHCVIASFLAPHGLRYAALMHELDEPFFGDASTQLKELCPDIRKYAKGVAAHFAPYVGIEWPQPPIIKRIDNCLLRNEHIHLCDNREYADEHLGEYTEFDSLFPQLFKQWPAHVAVQKFIKRFDTVKPSFVTNYHFNVLHINVKECVL